ncbi:MAG: hypothetical protein IH614_03505 [Desulfuromonadales bacterium]|nr:hypothetical protein [Desulfuromonadales bacterium]
MLRPCCLLLQLLIVCLLTGCALPYQPEQQLLPAHDDFADRLRWLDIPEAARHFSPELAEEFRRQMDDADLHITDVRLESADYLPEPRRMITWSIAEFYRLPSTTVRTHRFRLEWEYLPGKRFQSGSWQIITSFPEFPEAPRRE